MLRKKTKNELTSKKNIAETSDSDITSELGNYHFRPLAEPRMIENLLSQIPENPFVSIKELLAISDEQYISVPESSVSDIMSVLTNTFSPTENNPEIIILRRNIYQFLINIIDGPIKDDRSFCVILSNPTYISLFCKDFPVSDYSTMLLSKIVEKNPPTTEYIINHEINMEQILSYMSLNNPPNVIENILSFFSSAFPSIANFMPNIMDPFVESTCNLISNCLINIFQNNDDVDFEELLENAKEMLEKMSKSYIEVATKIVPFLPTICIFNELDSTSNMNTNLLLEAVVTKLNTYQVLLATDPNKVTSFIFSCFDKSDINDLSLFYVIELLTANEDYSPFIADVNFSKLLFEKLINVIINRNEKYKLKSNAVLVVCGLIKCGTQQQIIQFLEMVDFSSIFEFAEQDNPKVQKSILEAIFRIDLVQQNLNDSNSSFISTFFDDDNRMQIINELIKSSNEEVSNYAKMINEKIDF